MIHRKNNPKSTRKAKGRPRRVEAPPTAPYAHVPLPAGQVLSVDLAADEKVRWIWTHPLNGRSFVSGFEILEE